jgi:hypothetical protein
MKFFEKQKKKQKKAYLLEAPGISCFKNKTKHKETCCPWVIFAIAM